MSFDYLIVATGMQSSYFGHDEFAEHAPSLKTLADAEAIRTKVLSAYELAELTDDLAERAKQLTFVVVGGGPTGVEMAASLAEMARITLRSNFRRIDPALSSIILVEGGKRILPTFHESLASVAAERLERLGVKLRIGAVVERVDEHSVVVGGERIESATVLWAAGVTASPVVKMLGVATDRTGRVAVGTYLNVRDEQGIFVVGDAASIMQDDRPLPGVAQVAIQSGAFVGRFIADDIEGIGSPEPFRYLNQGNLVVVGKNFAVFERNELRISGFAAWLIWAFIHMARLPQLQNRLRVEIQWLWSYFTGQRGSRLIPETPTMRQVSDVQRLKTS